VFTFISMQIDDARQEGQQAAQAADTKRKFHGLKKEKPQKGSEAGERFSSERVKGPLPVTVRCQKIIINNNNNNRSNYY